MGTLIVRIDPELKEKAARLARAEGKTLSEVVRQLLGAYVQDRDISLYVDDLWDRIGKQMRGVGTEAINQAVLEVRGDTT